MRFIVAQWTRYLPVHHDCFIQPFSAYRGALSTHPSSLSHTMVLARQAAERLGCSFSSATARSAACMRHSMQRLQAALLRSVLVMALLQLLEDIWSLMLSVPRTVRTVSWAVRAGLSYKRFFTCHIDRDSAEYLAAFMQLHTFWAQQLLQVCRLNGGVYVKAGQFAAAFGALPREYRTLLAQLEDRAVARPYSKVRKALLAELGPDIDTIFAEFETKATAAASLAQVHRARLASGEVVAVKVQYPGLAGSVAADLTTMRVLGALAAFFFPDFQLRWVYQELERKLQVELDFRNEISNSQRFQAVLDTAGERDVKVPALHLHLCSKRIITMEWIDGTKVTDVDSLQRQGINPRMVGCQLAKLFAELMFIHGYVHGDPHPGNLMVRKKGRPAWWRWLFLGCRQGFEMVLLDHGVYVEIDQELRHHFCQLWCALMLRDGDAARDISTAIGGERAGRILPVLLTHRARSRDEERQLQRSVGVNNLSDMTQLMGQASPVLVDILRINTVIRASTNLLGVTMLERVRINGSVARRGLPPRGSRLAHIHRNFEGAWYRVQLGLSILAFTTMDVAVSLGARSWETMLSVFGEALFE